MGRPRPNLDLALPSAPPEAVSVTVGPRAYPVQLPNRGRRIEDSVGIAAAPGSSSWEYRSENPWGLENTGLDFNYYRCTITPVVLERARRGRRAEVRVASIGLTELQMEIMQVLWTKGAASVAEVHEAMSRRRLAQATIATLLRRMEKKGAVSHEKNGRLFEYRARITADEARRSRIAEVADRLFSGQVPALIHHLLAQRKIGAEELAEVKALIEAKEREARGK